MYKIFIEDNKHTRKFLKKYSKYASVIEENIKEVLPKLIVEKPYKIKTAYGYKYNGEVIFEYKIKLDNHLDCRAAYTKTDDELKIFYISHILIKKEFVKLLENVEGVGL
ncbi:MAG: hypothetical protein ACRCYE_10435 [Sarcina sp.]